MLIFWDIDGTLMYCGADGAAALTEAFKELYDIDDAFEKVGIGRALDSAILEKIMNKFNIPYSDLDKIESVSNMKLKKILDGNDKKRVLPGIRELLYYTERKGHINSLLTSNLRSGAEIKLRSVGLDGLFTGGGFGDGEGEKWNIAVKALKEIEQDKNTVFKASDILIIGDSVYDIETARKLGYNIISVATGWTSEDDLKKANPDILFSNFGDADAVMEVIDRMSKGE